MWKLCPEGLLYGEVVVNQSVFRRPIEKDCPRGVVVRVADDNEAIMVAEAERVRRPTTPFRRQDSPSTRKPAPVHYELRRPATAMTTQESIVRSWEQAAGLAHLRGHLGLRRRGQT